jgi:hypothetical protein
VIGPRNLRSTALFSFPLLSQVYAHRGAMGNIFDVSPATVGSDPAVVDERCPSVCPEMLVKALAAETADGRAFKRVALNSEDTFLIIVEDVLSRQVRGAPKTASHAQCSSQECLQLIQTFETRGFAQALITGADGKQRLDRGVRDSCQIVLEDDELVGSRALTLACLHPYRSLTIGHAGGAPHEKVDAIPPVQMEWMQSRGASRPVFRVAVRSWAALSGLWALLMPTCSTYDFYPSRTWTWENADSKRRATRRAKEASSQCNCT